MMVADSMAGHFTVAAGRLRMFTAISLMDVKHFAGMGGTMATGMGSHGHDNNPEKQPDQDQK